MRGAVLLLVLAGCSNAYDSALLKLHYEPPSGVKLVEESAGPPATARFSEGLEIRSVGAALPELDDKTVESLLPRAFELAGVTSPGGRVTSSKVGSIKAGPVARFEVKAQGKRQLIYVVPQKSRFVMLVLTTGQSDDGKAEAHFEQSLSSLRLE